MNLKNLWNHWAILNFTWQQLSLGGPLKELCPMTWSAIQDGRQAKNRKKGGWNLKNLLLWKYWANILAKFGWNGSWVVIGVNFWWNGPTIGSFQNCIGHLPTKRVASAKLACAIQTIVNSNGFNANVMLETVWQVSDDRLLGASGLFLFVFIFRISDFFQEL